MAWYVAKRVATMFATLFAVVLLTFMLMHSIPGGPFTAERKLPDAVEQALVKKYNLDAPLHEQFIDYVRGLLVFDLGPSFKYEGRSVNEFIAEGFPLSSRLGLMSIVFILFLALPLGCVSAIKSGKWQDLLIMFLATLGITIPSFVIATALMYLFSYRLGWLPVFGVSSVKGYVLPVIALSGYSLAFITRLMRSSLLEVMGQDYIRTARAKGLSETAVLVKHAMRNALLPVVTILGPTLASLLTGSFVIEKIFALPGMGIHFVTSIANRDYTAIMGITIFYATILVAMVFIVDIFYVMIDPRIKLQ
ncbi:MAG: ABC transporter permease [Spirochaetes bacterium]|nr:ABC transporter permease [Spirochaetota bacterium]MBU1081053.1 ABC transporter permease [Spirochaetota bacterium]